MLCITAARAGDTSTTRASAPTRDPSTATGAMPFVHLATRTPSTSDSVSPWRARSISALSPSFRSPRDDGLASRSAMDRLPGVSRGGRRCGNGLSPNARPPSSPSPTMRSAQPSGVRTNWRIGSASKNSLAMRISGPAGRFVDPVDARPARTASSVASAAPAASRSRGTRLDQMDAAPPRRSAGRMRRRAARRPSACRDPGRARRGRMAPARPSPARPRPPRAPISSPKIWLTSGAVTKSPPRPNGSRRM